MSNAAIAGDGDRLVGSEVQPGVYVTSGSTTSCYWETVSSFDKQLSSIDNNDIGSGQRIMKVNASDYGVHTSRCGAWVRPADAPAVTTIGTGEYFVGQQVPAGTYRASVPDGGCYWATLSDFDGSLSSIIANDYVSGPSTATVAISSDAVGFETSGCGAWSRIG